MSKRRRDDSGGVDRPDRVEAVVAFLTPKLEPVSQQQLQTGTGLSGEDLMHALNALLQTHRVKVFASGTATSYKLVAEDVAAKLASLSVEDRLVLGFIEKAGWVTLYQELFLNSSLAD